MPRHRPPDDGLCRTQQQDGLGTQGQQRREQQQQQRHQQQQHQQQQRMPVSSSISTLLTLMVVMLVVPLVPLAAASNRDYGFPPQDPRDGAIADGQQWPAVAFTTHPQQQIHQRPHAIETPKLVGRSTHPYPLQQKQHADRNDNRIDKENTPDIGHAAASSNVRAFTTLAPAQAVRAPPLRGDVSLPQSAARHLDEWAVEDFVLLAAVGGDLYAMERRTGRHMWRIPGEPPIVHTVHYPAGNGRDDDDDDVDVDVDASDGGNESSFKDLVWAVEPTGGGDVYIWNPSVGTGLMRTGFSMKQLVEQMAGYKSEGPAVVYTGSKQTVMLTIDAATGHVLKRFGNSNYFVSADAESCARPTSLYGRGNTECKGTITLGRTEYTVEVQRYDGRPIATLKYAEWVPNSFDRDLVQQYEERLEAFDRQYILTTVDGGLVAWDHSSGNRPEESFLYNSQYGATIGRVFDVCRPPDSEAQAARELVILPHPLPSQAVTVERSSTVYLNQTAHGGWYALSGAAYPLALKAPLSRAEVAGHGFRRRTAAATFDHLVGKHYLTNSGRRSTGHRVALLPAPPPTTSMPELGQLMPPPPPSSADAADAAEPRTSPTIIDKVKSLPRSATDRVVDLLTNPVLMILGLAFLFYKQNKVRRWYKNTKIRRWFKSGSERKVAGAAEDKDATVSSAADEEKPVPAEGRVDGGQAAVDGPVKVAPASEEAPEQKNAEKKPPQPPAEQPPDGQPPADQPPEKPKRKAQRGRRAGASHRKKKRLEKLAAEQSEGEEPAPGSIEEAVSNAKKMAASDERLQADIQTVGHDMQEVGAGMLRMGNMEVDMNTQLGTGSNGTLVFAGKFGGREVAVKRMLVQFYDIASQETRLLRESDDHPNVIRYYEQQVLQSFLYIALERCAASLADVIEKPHMYRDIAKAGEQDMRDVLRQIASGICHLHRLRIVHRDLKPHNILVKIDQDGRPCLKVSDFGLCKKLDNTQSSFGATTGRAAGTCGWRAPELLLDDDGSGPDDNAALTPPQRPNQGDGDGLDASSDGGSGSLHVGMPGNPQDPSPRRATRSIDIFSLGLVFFYVLTRGQHPFDRGDRYMREVNIRKGNYSLAELDVLGDVADEARDLVSKMICANPRERISAADVLAHLFFWDPKKRLRFLCDVSDGFEKETRDPPSAALLVLESYAPDATRGDFLRHLPAAFLDSLGKQRKYTGSRLLDLLRALRNKRNHYEDMDPALQALVGGLHDGGYLDFWTRRFPTLMLACWCVVRQVGWSGNDRFKEYYVGSER